MNRIKHVFAKTLVVMLFALCLTKNANATLSGTYTINPGGTASSTVYLTLSSALSDLASGTRADGGPANGAGVSGAVILELAVGYTSGTENFPLTFGNITGTSATNTITVRPAAGVGSALTISSTGGSQTFFLNGCKYLVLDGRPGGTGTSRYLTINNTGAFAPSIELINDASNNTVKYCTITGVVTGTTSGVINFGVTSGTTGNDNNTIDNCDIGDGATTPANLIYSSGTSTKENSGNTISNCNIYNFFSATTANNGITLTGNNTTWSITGNRFYQTATRTYTSGVQSTAINITSGNGHTISNNTIGYSSSAGTGTYTMTAAVSATFRAINLTVGASSATSVQGNTITAISLTTTSTSGTGSATVAGALCGISVNAGNVNIGTTSGNTFGAATGTGAIVLIPGGGGGIIGINASSANGTINIQNNTFGSLTSSSTTPGNGAAIHCIYSGVAGILNVSNNTIGNTTANNIAGGTSAFTTGGPAVSGVNAAVAPTNFTCSNNTIQNMVSYGSGTGFVRGIATATTGTSTSTTITGNTVKNLASNSSLTGFATGITNAEGIHMAAGLFGTISGNTIFNISCTNTGTGNYVATGIGLGAAYNTSVYNNTIYGISNAGTGTTSATPPIIAGITIAGYTNSLMVYNNMISLGNGQATNTTIIGIYGGFTTTTSGTAKIYYNTVNIEGTVTSGSLPSFGFNRGDLSVTARTGFVDIRNNIFNNTRSGGSGKHYAISNNFGATASVTGWGNGNSNYNLLNANSSNLAYWSADKDFSSWKTTTGCDGNSVANSAVTFTATATANLHLNMGTTATPVESGGIAITDFTIDMDAQSRPGGGITNGGGQAPDLGADEFDGVSLDLTAPTVSYTTLGNNTSTTTRTTNNFATITDAVSGVNTTSGTRPRFYYKKSTDANAFVGNTSADNGWKWVEANGTTAPFNFTIDYSIINGGTVTVADVIQYFVVAQDLASTPNVSSLPQGIVATSVSSITSAPASPNSYTISAGSSTPLSGAYNVGSGQTYTTLTAAITDLNLRGVSSAVTFNLTDAGYTTGSGETFPISISVIEGASSTNTITIKPASGVTASVSGSATQGAIILNGADYIIIDGSNNGTNSKNLTITNTSTAATTSVINLVSAGAGAGASNDVIKNCLISNGTLGAANYGIFIGSTPGFTGADNDNVTIQNNTISSCAVGIAAYGNITTSSNEGQDNFTVTQNTINITGSTVTCMGMQLGFNKNMTVSQNTVNINTSVGAAPDGISIETGVTSSTVTRNQVTVVTTNIGGWGSRGITVATGLSNSNVTVSNNVIYGITGSNFNAFQNSSSLGLGVGIFGNSTSAAAITYTAGGVNLYNNSVNLYGTYTGGDNNDITAALYIGAAASNLDIRNNVFVNTMDNIGAGTNPKAYAVYSAASSNAPFTTMNYNDFYVSGAEGVLGFLSSDITTLSGLQSSFGQNVNSINGDPIFTSNTNLQPSNASPVASAGTSIAGVTVDYAGTTRSAPPAIGAYEAGIIWTGATNTTWATNTNWSTNTVPTSADAVIIPGSLSNYPVIASGTQSCKGLTISSGASLTVNGGGTLQIGGNISNSGTFNATGGTIELNGSQAQNIAAGTINVTNFKLNNSTGATIASGMVNVLTAYQPVTGTLAAGGFMTLKSTASGTAYVEEGFSGGGYISGDVIIERYIPGGKRALRLFAHPFTSTLTLNSLTDDIDITGSGGSANGFTTVSGNVGSAYWFNIATADNTPSRANPGWAEFTNATTTSGNNGWAQYQGISVLCRGAIGQGLGAPVTPSAVTLDMAGALNQGNLVVTATKGSGSTLVLIGNPYPSNINVNTSTRGSNIGSSFYVWDPYSGAKGAYVTNTFGSSYILPAYAAFFVTTSANTNNTITFHEGDKTAASSTASLFKTTAVNNGAYFKLYSDSDSIKWDEYRLHFDDNAAADSEWYDAIKMYNPDASLYSFSKNGTPLAIDVRPYAENEVIPMGLIFAKIKSYTFKAEELDMPAGTHLFLHDKYLNNTVELHAGDSYPFDVTSDVLSQGNNRFELNTKGKPTGIATATNKPKVQLVPNPTKENVIVYYEGMDDGDIKVTVTNMVGITMTITKQASANTGSILIPMQNLPAGMYMVEVKNGNQIFTQKLVKQ